MKALPLLTQWFFTNAVATSNDLSTAEVETAASAVKNDTRSLFSFY